jgi:hypothetical protein
MLSIAERTSGAKNVKFGWSSCRPQQTQCPGRLCHLLSSIKPIKVFRNDEHMLLRSASCVISRDDTI